MLFSPSCFQRPDYRCPERALQLAIVRSVTEKHCAGGHCMSWGAKGEMCQSTTYGLIPFEFEFQCWTPFVSGGWDATSTAASQDTGCREGAHVWICVRRVRARWVCSVWSSVLSFAAKKINKGKKCTNVDKCHASWHEPSKHNKPTPCPTDIPPLTDVPPTPSHCSNTAANDLAFVATIQFQTCSFVVVCVCVLCSLDSTLPHLNFAAPFVLSREIIRLEIGDRMCLNVPHLNVFSHVKILKCFVFCSGYGAEHVRRGYVRIGASGTFRTGGRNHPTGGRHGHDPGVRGYLYPLRKKDAAQIFAQRNWMIIGAPTIGSCWYNFQGKLSSKEKQWFVKLRPATFAGGKQFILELAWLNVAFFLDHNPSWCDGGRPCVTNRETSVSRARAGYYGFHIRW